MTIAGDLRNTTDCNQSPNQGHKGQELKQRAIRQIACGSTTAHTKSRNPGVNGLPPPPLDRVAVARDDGRVCVSLNPTRSNQAANSAAPPPTRRTRRRAKLRPFTAANKDDERPRQRPHDRQHIPRLRRDARLRTRLGDEHPLSAHGRVLRTSFRNRPSCVGSRHRTIVRASPGRRDRCATAIEVNLDNVSNQPDTSASRPCTNPLRGRGVWGEVEGRLRRQ